jgi:membrane peptidoglycan carboxypeptidase
MFQKYTTSIVPSTLTLNGMIYQLSYDVGRKDAVLNRMYEDGYITQDQLKRAFADGLMLKLKSAVIDIKAPHFVFFIRDLLIKGDTRFKDLGITEDMLYQGGIQIKTTLDLDIQEVAEKAVSDNMPILYDRGGNNRSLLHVDTTNGDVLAYVWSAGYNNTKIQGQNDMVRNARQPGSSVKPLIYAYALQTLPITIDTPIYDIPLTVGTLTPNNADGKFEWLVPLREALGHSRNIPAVKAYFAAGKEPELKPFLQGLGLKSLKNNNSYGYSLALGAGEVPMLEMAQAYSFLSQKWEWYDINPILEIRGADGELLYKKEPKKIVSWLKSGVAYLMWKILSETANMPSGWIRYYAINGLKYAVKSWTSNKVIKVNGEDKSVPRDWWLATYTPSRVTMYWAGNADDTPMNKNALWLLLNSEVNKSFYSQMLSKWYIKNEDMSPVDVASLSISKVTGKIATASTPEQFVIKTLAFNSAIGLDGPYIPVTIDTSCGKKASPLTPSEQRINAFVFTPTSIASIDLVDINLWYNNRLKSFNSTGDNTSFEDIVLITKEPDGVCDGRDVQLSDDITLTTSLVADQIVPNKFSFSFTAQSSIPIKKVTVLLNDAIIWSFAYNTTTVFDTKTVRLRNIIGTGKQNLEIIAFNEDNKAQLVSLPVTVWWEDGKVFSLPTVPVSSSGELVGTWE